MSDEHRGTDRAVDGADEREPVVDSARDDERELRADGSGEGDRVGDEGYDEWIAAVAEGEGYYLACPNGHGSLPPRRLCPHCGSRELEERALPEVGEVQTFTETHVPIPSFDEDAPYVVAVAAFGDARVTGQLRGIDAGDVGVGTEVILDVAERETTDDPLVVFRPA